MFYWEIKLKIKLFFLLFLVIFLTSNNVYANGTWERTRAQGVQLARMCINEDSRALRKSPSGSDGNITIDHKMIALVVWNNRYSKESFSGWLDVMKFLSPHVGRIKKVKNHRHDWTSTLSSYGGKPPVKWVDCKYNKINCDGNWGNHYKYWIKFRKSIINYWINTNFSKLQKIKNIRPKKWGSKRDVVRFLKKYPKSFCVLPDGDKNFFLARNGDGCKLGDKYTLAARKGVKL